MIGIERQLDPPVQRLCDGAWRVFELIEYRAPAVANLGGPRWHEAVAHVGLGHFQVVALDGNGRQVAPVSHPERLPAGHIPGHILQSLKRIGQLHRASRSESRVRHGDDQRGGAYLQEGRSLRA